MVMCTIPLSTTLCPTYGLSAPRHPFLTTDILAAYHSQFLASKNRILHRPLSAYKFLLNALHQPDTDPMLQLPGAQMAGYVIERLWNALFDCWDVQDLPLHERPPVLVKVATAMDCGST